MTSLEPVPPAQGEGILQRWFPGWGGWYGYGQPQAESAVNTQSDKCASYSLEDGCDVENEKLSPVSEKEAESSLPSESNTHLGKQLRWNFN